MTTTFRILTVCVGNVCRSPLAQLLLSARLPEDRYTVSSAGLWGMTGRPMDSNAAAEARRLDVSPDGFVARRVSADLVTPADLILAATAEIRSAVLEEWPAALHRTFTLLEFAQLSDRSPADVGSPTELVRWAARHRADASGAELDVGDPMGKSSAVHRQVADTIDDATARIARAFTDLS